MRQLGGGRRNNRSRVRRYLPGRLTAIAQGGTDAVSAKRRDPLDAQAWSPKEAVQARAEYHLPDKFDALRARGSGF